MKKEREFLHAIASPLTTAKLVLETVIDDCEESGDEAKAERLKKVLASLERMNVMLSDRRSEAEELP